MSDDSDSNPTVVKATDKDPINNKDSSSSEEVAIEPPHLPGNYSARKSNKWLISNSTSTSLDTLGNIKPKGKPHSYIEDEIHTSVSPWKVAPGQLYSTDSGRLFHAGKLLICSTGLPGRGKTHMSVSLTRYLRWLGVSTQVFHFDDFRREYLKKNIPPSFFSQKTSNEQISKMKSKLIDKCLGEIEEFFMSNKGQVVIYDAINGSAQGREVLQDRFTKQNVKVVFIESLINNVELLNNSLKDAIKSPDYAGWNPDQARKDFNKRIEEATSSYEVIGEVDKNECDSLSYIKIINFGEQLVMNRSQNGYLINRITFFLLNTRIKKGSIFFARCGDTENHKNLLYKMDPQLTEEGKTHSKFLLKQMVDLMRQKNIKEDEIKDNLTIWTSTRTRTMQTAQVFEKYDVQTIQRSELTQLNPGMIESLTKSEIIEKFPIEYEQFKKDPYHVRFPRGESYHDLAVRLEPLILELERNTTNILIIGHESVLKVLHGYLLNTNSNDIPYNQFPADEIVEVKYNAYSNTSDRIKITKT